MKDSKLRSMIKIASFTVITSFFMMSSAYAAINMKLSHNHPRTHPVHIAMQSFADRVKELTDGEIRIRLYPDASLGDQKDSLEQVQNGAIALAKSNAAELEAFHDIYGAYNYPYLFENRDHYYRVMLGDIGDQILKSSQDKGFIGIAYYDAGARSFYAKKPINSASDLIGMKIRVQPSPTAVKMTNLLGAVPTPLAYGELYTALQQGVVDGAENNSTALTLSRHGEVAKYYSLDEHTMIPDILVMSTKVWNELTEKQRESIQIAAKESTLKMKDLWTDSIDVEEEKARNDMGVTFIEVDKKSFQEAVSPMYDELKTNNPKLYEIVEKIRAEK